MSFTEPDADIVAKYGYTWDQAAYDGSTPIHSSFPPFLWGDHFVVRNAWKEMGVVTRNECAAGEKDGLCWIPVSQYPKTARRSHAGLGHYASINDTRPNYDLLVRHQVTRVIYPNSNLSRIPIIEVRSLKDGNLFNLTATSEVILAAGAFHTPAILQRSGIGATSVLEEVGVAPVLDLPGVGANLQDHSGPVISWDCKLSHET